LSVELRLVGWFIETFQVSEISGFESENIRNRTSVTVCGSPVAEAHHGAQKPAADRSPISFVRRSNRRGLEGVEIEAVSEVHPTSSSVTRPPRCPAGDRTFLQRRLNVSDPESLPHRPGDRKLDPNRANSRRIWGEVEVDAGSVEIEVATAFQTRVRTSLRIAS